MNLNTVLGLLLLVVLLAPLAAAALIAIGGRGRPGLTRRLAVYASALHLVLTIGMIALYSGFVTPDAQSEQNLSLNFQPKAVPGDPGATNGAETFTYSTSWKLVSLTPGETGPAVHFYVGLDGLNVLLVALTSLMFFFAVLVSWDTVRERAAAYYGWLFVLQTAVTGAFVSFDVLLFYVFFELTLIPAFFLIGQWGTGSARRDAARKFVLYTLFGSLFTLVGIIGVVLTNPIPLHPTSNQPFYYEPTHQAMAHARDQDGPYVPGRAGPITFSIPVLMKNVSMWDSMSHYSVLQAEGRLAKATPNLRADRERELADVREKQRERSTTQFWLFLALMAGFAVKIPIVPFHTWLPATYSEAPLAVTMIFSAVLAKLGTFGILRIVIPLVPEACVQYGLPWFGTLGAIGIVYAAFCAFAQRDLRLLAAYSSVSHLGFLVIGLFAMTPEGLSGALLHMVNHGLTAGAVFALLSFLARRYRTLDANQYGGLWAKYPVFTFLMIVIVLANVGLPGLNNFVSEMLMLGGLFDPRNVKIAGWGLALVAAFGVMLSSWYLFTMLKRVFFGPLIEPPTVGEADARPKDVTGREFVPLAALAALCLTLGLFPQPLLDVVSTDVRRVSELVNRARYRLDPSIAAAEAENKPPVQPIRIALPAPKR
ncbi:complex I subunit 4 family protein [Limnoglobus roseus]|uniref:NADH-quinone oxidoreductase subunit M n=1 Tax=Limnoglobus roseus TaxID=2598579 RepID=A0A5C1AFL4_9BACT|nr:NADH-quinone oxidoreductase subunit M [Limnoglobus roseus]QEL17013.1 NADH-quinone oxidoreductase subunit M [Limnoglobus roseus]